MQFFKHSVNKLLDMENNKDRTHHHLHFKKRQKKLQTNKVIDRITFNTKVHKQKRMKRMRQALQQREIKDPPSSKLSSPSLKFGSFNINGLDIETSWAVGELLKRHEFDVLILIITLCVTILYAGADS